MVVAFLRFQGETQTMGSWPALPNCWEYLLGERSLAQKITEFFFSFAVPCCFLPGVFCGCVKCAKFFQYLQCPSWLTIWMQENHIILSVSIEGVRSILGRTPQCLCFICIPCLVSSSALSDYYNPVKIWIENTTDIMESETLSQDKCDSLIPQIDEGKIDSGWVYIIQKL